MRILLCRLLHRLVLALYLTSPRRCTGNHQQSTLLNTATRFFNPAQFTCRGESVLTGEYLIQALHALSTKCHTEATNDLVFSMCGTEPIRPGEARLTLDSPAPQGDEKQVGTLLLVLTKRYL